MTKDIFIGRNQEQEQFRQILRNYHQGIVQRWLPTLSKPLGVIFKTETELPQKPSILLLYGEGGMGKSTLMQRFEKIVDESPFYEKEKYKNFFRKISIDWDDYKNEPELSVGYDQIQPKAALDIFHRIVSQNFGEIKAYKEKLSQLNSLESKVDQKLQEQLPESNDSLKQEILEVGSKGLAWAVRTVAATQTGAISTVISDSAIETLAKIGLQLSAESLSHTRRLLQQVLTPDEQELYTRPHIQLAKVIGEGLASVSKHKPLVVFLDTYEILDRRECDEAFRKVISYSGGQVVWVIAGRANLADSGERGGEYFRGYRSEFSENVYASGLREFGTDEIQVFFREKSPKRPLSKKQTEELSVFSYGIPFVINLAAEIWKEGIPFEEIIAPPKIGETRKNNAHYKIVREMSERFLKHCLNKAEDKRVIYALAMVRQPVDPSLVKAMLNITDLEPELQMLRQRYSFIWADELRLDDKLTKFLNEYLLEPVRRSDDLIQKLNQQALAWLELRREQVTKDLTDRQDWFADETVAKLLLDEVHHRFWQEDSIEDRCGWRALVPLFVEGWIYSRSWSLQLIEIAASFKSAFISKQEIAWLQIFREGLEADPEEKDERMQSLIRELETLEKRDWLKGAGENARKVILQIKKGEVQHCQSSYFQELESYLSVQSIAANESSKIRKRLSYQIARLGFSLSLQESGEAVMSKNIKSLKEVFEISAKLYNANPLSWLGIGLYHEQLRKYKEAASAYQKTIDIDPNLSLAHVKLGDIYARLNDPEQSVFSYQRALDIDPEFSSAYAGIGHAYREMDKHQEALIAYEKSLKVNPDAAYIYYHASISAFHINEINKAVDLCQEAVRIDPNYAPAFYNLGVIYLAQSEPEKAISAFREVLRIKPEYSRAYEHLGDSLRRKEAYEEAELNYKRAIELNANSVKSFEGLGEIYWLQGSYGEGLNHYSQAVNLSPDSDNLNSSGWLCLVLGKNKEAEKFLLQSLEFNENYANLFNCGLLYALQNNFERANTYWQKGVLSCQEDPIFAHAFYLISLGEMERGEMELQDFIGQGLISNELRTRLILVAKIMKSCPQLSRGASTVLKILENSR